MKRNQTLGHNLIKKTVAHSVSAGPTVLMSPKETFADLFHSGGSSY